MLKRFHITQVSSKIRYNYKHTNNLSILLISMFLLYGCVPATTATSPKTQLQMREFQTRTYDVSDSKVAMKALANAFQDDGYIIKHAVVDLGLLTATKEVDAGTSFGEKFWASFFWGVNAKWKQNIIIEATANATELSDSTRVRVIFQAKIYDNKGGVVEVKQIDDEQFYKDFFAIVDKGMFLEKEKV